MKSKKIVSLILTGAMVLGFCSCSLLGGDKESEETSEETTTGEVTTTTTTEETTETTTEETTEATTETSTEKTTAATTTISVSVDDQEGTIFVSFQNKTAEEVKENIIKMCTIARDTTMDSYPDAFTVYPNDTVYKDNDVSYCTYFWDPVARNSPEGVDHIMVHIVRKTDGSLDPGSRVQISVICEDKDRWMELYSAACEALKTVCECESFLVTGGDQLESSIHSTYFVTREALSDGRFSLLIELPFVDAKDEVPVP